MNISFKGFSVPHAGFQVAAWPMSASRRQQQSSCEQWVPRWARLSCMPAVKFKQGLIQDFKLGAWSKGIWGRKSPPQVGSRDKTPIWVGERKSPRSWSLFLYESMNF